MIDIHCHILPGVDDGSRDLDESVQIVRTEFEGGTRSFIATPHVLEERDLDRIPIFDAALQDLRKALAEEGIGAVIHPGAEVYPFMGVIRELDKGLDLSLGRTGKYLLVDTPLHILPNDFESFLFELQSRRLTPILAHPERSAAFQGDLVLLEKLMGKGAVLQINIGSLLGRYGPIAKSIGAKLIADRWAQFVATDLHRVPGKAYMGLFASNPPDGVDSDYVELLTQKSQEAILAATPLPARPEKPPEVKKSLLGRLFGRK